MTNEEAKDGLEEIRIVLQNIKFLADNEEVIKRENCVIDMAISAIKKQIQIENDIENFSDGYHTFNQLYHQRAILFATIVNLNKDKCWKTHCHEDGEECFGGGWFLVTIETPKGAYGYHYEDKYWDLFACEDIPKAKHWDGYTEEDVTRLLSL